MKIIIGADLAPTQSNYNLFINSNVDALIGQELYSLLNNVDVRIFNLETPLCIKQDPIPKHGPNLIAPPDTIAGIKALNPTLLSLANNHILDQGEQGLISTEKVLKKNKIPFIGAGGNIAEACQPFIFEYNKVTIGIYACAENEFSIATKETPGANPFDPVESFDHIKKLKEKCDYIVVLYHGGKEFYPYPSPYLQKVCRKMIMEGADLIICQHSHCIGCFENYLKGLIIYGQGNFLFDSGDSEFEKSGLLIKIKIADEFKVDYIPIIKVGSTICLADNREQRSIISSFYRRSEEISKKGFIEQQYSQLALDCIDSYLRRLSGFNNLLLRIDSKILNGMLIKRKYKQKQLLSLKNYIECEAHRELIIAGLTSKIDKHKNKRKYH